MKKFVSILLVVVMMASVCSVSAFAESTHEFQPYEQEFLQYMEEKWYYPESFNYGYYYSLVYSHYVNEADDAPSWVLIKAYASIYDAASYGIFDDYVLSSGDGLPYGFGYFFYDIAENKFYMFHEAWELGLIDMEELKANSTLDISILGDADEDGSLTIMDSTEIQLCLAKVKELQTDYFFRFAGSEYGGVIEHIADRNCDGSVDIIDATAIQLKLAKIEEQPVVNEKMVYSEFNNMYGVDTCIEAVAFETLYNGYYDVEDKMNCERYAVIIKSKEQLDSAFYSYVDLESVLNDEFFKDKWLVVSACRVTDNEMGAEITDLGVRNKTMFIRADSELLDSDGIAEPIAQMYYSFVAVDKDVLAQVTEIIWL